MDEFGLFKKVIVGNFNNKKQIEKELEEGKQVHPFAEHINTICNDKIKNLPEKFNGIFLIEESYYTISENGVKRSLPHLFLFTETENKKVKLISYEIPKNINKTEFRASNEKLELDYDKLQISEKFTPMIYNYDIENGFYGKSFSEFSADTTFLLEETLSENTLEVSEILKKGDKVLVGFESPIIYNRI